MAELTANKKISGVCVCSPSLIPDSCQVELLSIAKEYRRCRFGKKLLFHTLRNMRMLGYKRAYLWVNENNSEAIAFFEKCGFERDGKRRLSENPKVCGEELRFRIDIK